MMVNIYIYVYWLVVEPYPSEKYEMMEFVSWDDYSSQLNGTINSHVP